LSRQIFRTTEAPASPLFSQAIRAGSMIYVSGTAGIDPRTNTIAGSTIQEQTEQALANCDAILRAAGSSLASVVDVLVLLARPTDFGGLNEAWAKAFPKDPPARAVAKLGVELPNLLVSLKMTAVASGS
jgi:2-iminobutanoate/2-iminopropanoate deaminase